MRFKVKTDGEKFNSVLALLEKHQKSIKLASAKRCIISIEDPTDQLRNELVALGASITVEMQLQHDAD